MAQANRVVGYLDDDLHQQWQAIVKHLGVSESAAVQWLVRAEARRMEGTNSKERQLADILARSERLESKLDMLLLMAWAIAGKDSVKLSSDDVKQFIALAAELLGYAQEHNNG